MLVVLGDPLRDKAKSFFISSSEAPEPFDYAKLGSKAEGEVATLDYKLFTTYDGQKISPWHQVPLAAGTDPDGFENLNFVCEIPKGTTAKMEVNKESEHNPIIQDTKKGKLRYYMYNPQVGSLINYGAFVQTWENSLVEDEELNLVGDNDPIDVLQLNSEPCKPGEIMPLRVLGVFALIDGGETDWKVLAVRYTAETAHLKDVDDVPISTRTDLVEWFRRYKTAEGKGLNTIGLNEQIMNRSYAMSRVADVHRHWRSLFRASQLNGEL